MNKIIVVDGIMGCGKTSWAIQEMNNHPEKSYIYITPFLDEVKRIKENTHNSFSEPQQLGKGKLAEFHDLLSTGNNIVSTHALFSMATEETRNLIRQGKYILILDEVLDVVGSYNSEVNKDKQIKKDDIKLLLDHNFITIDDNGYIIWNDKKDYLDSRYSDIQVLSKNKSLVCVDNTVLLWHFPIETFTLFNEIYILTYMFNGQVMESYFTFHGLQFSYKQIKCNQESTGKKIYSLTEYNPNQKYDTRYDELINICSYDKLNFIGLKETALSKSWYQNKAKEKDKPFLEQLKNNITNYFTNQIQARSVTIAWTTFKEFENTLTAKGRKNVKVITKEDKKNLTERELNKFKCFIPCNSRATNDYADRYNLAYTINRFVDPYIKKFFSRKNINLDEETIALSEMIQWIWRSRIRNNQSINIYIPSSRMRKLLIEWINKIVKS